MATRKRTTKKTTSKRFVTYAEAQNIRKKYYSLKNYIYNLWEKDSLNTTAKSYLKKAIKACENFSKQVNLPRMTNFKHD